MQELQQTAARIPCLPCRVVQIASLRLLQFYADFFVAPVVLFGEQLVVQRRQAVL